MCRLTSSSTLVEDLAEIVRESPGDADLFFNISSPESSNITLMSRSVKVRVDRHLVRYIKEHPEISITIN